MVWVPSLLYTLDGRVWSHKPRKVMCEYASLEFFQQRACFTTTGDVCAASGCLLKPVAIAMVLALLSESP